MNQGGAAGHDDYGLPPVDIEIPDDARELYRDVQAYHRELRALRRHQRSRRFSAPLRRTGFVLPIAAGFLILALISGMVLTVFSANPYLTGFGAGSGRSRTAAGKGAPVTAPPSATSSASAPATAPGTTFPARLPGKTISVAGRPLALRALRSIALAIIPASCGCAIAVRQLLAQARQAGVTVLLVDPQGSKAELARLAAIAGSVMRLATDRRNVLGSLYPLSGLTVLLIDARGAVTLASRLQPGLNLEQQLHQLGSRR